MLTVFTWGGGVSSVPHVRTPGLLVIVVVQPLVLVFGIYFDGLFEHPSVSVGVVGWLVRGAMNLARALQYTVQTGWPLIVTLEWLLPLTGFGSAESGIDRRVFGVVAIVLSLVSIVPWLAIIVPDI